MGQTPPPSEEAMTATESLCRAQTVRQRCPAEKVAETQTSVTHSCTCRCSPPEYSSVRNRKLPKCLRCCSSNQSLTSRKCPQKEGSKQSAGVGPQHQQDTSLLLMCRLCRSRKDTENENRRMIDSDRRLRLRKCMPYCFLLRTHIHQTIADRSSNRSRDTQQAVCTTGTHHH